ncbi:hypothetical protein HNR25_000717 [Streptomonospora salina]|uniref:Uncharacterized protein n=1 Tax=Streptomonospora salina TaxID=104205 RepID=A0A841E1P4_9ACTN|nr:hypothetical protein [Streptomonospora salina]
MGDSIETASVTSAVRLATPAEFAAMIADHPG